MIHLTNHDSSEVVVAVIIYLDLCIGESAYIYNIYIYTSGRTKLMLLESFTKHPSRSTADHISKSILCGRCGTVNCHLLLNL